MAKMNNKLTVPYTYRKEALKFSAGYVWKVYKNDEWQADFNTREDARGYIAEMLGKPFDIVWPPKYRDCGY